MESVVRALQAAVAATPDDVPLRLHLAQLMLSSGEAAGALEHAAWILAQQPAHTGALEVAAPAAEQVGDPRGPGYRTLLSALTGAAAPKPTPPAPAPAPTVEPPLSDSYDLRLLGAPGGVSTAPEDSEWSLPVRSESRDEGLSGRDRYLEVDPDDDPEPEELFEIERPTLRLHEVSGLHDVKRRLEVAFLGPLRNPELRAMYKKSLRGGLLLYGPPGCGKTFIARALAGELGAKLISIGLADVVDAYFGESEQRLRTLFDTGRRNAPCVLFFDEIDALGQKRSQLKGSGGRNIVNQLLSEMDSLGGNNEGLFILAATNCPWDVDPALRRPGRFDRTMLVLPPDAEARQGALRYHMDGRPGEGIDYGWLSARTDGYSGADLAHLCESAAESALEQSLSTGNARPIRMEDFRRALRDVRPTTRAWLEQAKNYAMFANEDGLYDDLAAYLKTARL